MTSPWIYQEEYYELEKPKTGNMNKKNQKREI